MVYFIISILALYLHIIYWHSSAYVLLLLLEINTFNKVGRVWALQLLGIFLNLWTKGHHDWPHLGVCNIFICCCQTQLLIKTLLGNINQPPHTHTHWHLFLKVTATDHTAAWLWKMSPSFEWSELRFLAYLLRAIWFLNEVVAAGCCWKNLAHSVLLQAFLRLFLSSYLTAVSPSK